MISGRPVRIEPPDGRLRPSDPGQQKELVSGNGTDPCWQWRSAQTLLTCAFVRAGSRAGDISGEHGAVRLRATFGEAPHHHRRVPVRRKRDYMDTARNLAVSCANSSVRKPNVYECRICAFGVSGPVG